jgi:prophage regulatory protein
MGEHKTYLLELMLSAEVQARIPYSHTHLRRLEATGDFPRRKRMGQNRVAWSRAEVEQWLADRLEAKQ